MASPSELPRPTAFGPTRPSLVEVGASCFCVGTCIRRGHSGSRLRRRFPFTGGSECPTPTESTLCHDQRYTLFVAFEHRRKRGEYLTSSFDCRSSKHSGERARKLCGRCIPSLLAPSVLADEGGVAPSIKAKIQSLTGTSSDGSPLQDERESPARDDTCAGDRVCPVSSKQGPVL